MNDNLPAFSVDSAKPVTYHLLIPPSLSTN